MPGYNATVRNKTLLNLCRTCHTLKDVAQAVLYQHISIRWDGKGSVLPLWALTRTIIERPDLASKVQKLTLPSSPQESTELRISQEPLLSDLQKSTFTECQNDIQKIWAFEAVHFMLCHLPNITELQYTFLGMDLSPSIINPPSEILGRIRDAHIQLTSQTTSHDGRHQRLTAFELSHDKIVSLPLDHIVRELASIFSLSALKSLKFRRRQMIHLPDALLLHSMMTRGLTNLELRDCAIDLASLRYFCTTACCLKHFAFVTLDPLSIYSGTLLGRSQLDQFPQVRQPTPVETLEALRCLSTSIETLELDFYEWFHVGCEALWEHDGTDPAQRYDSFASFERLTTLTIEYDRICPPKQLPRSLVALTLTHKSNKRHIVDDPLHYPRIEKSFAKLIADSVCPLLRFVKIGRFLPFRYIDGKVLDWRFINKRVWDRFSCDSVDFTFSDDEYHWVDEFTGRPNSAFQLDKWHDDWWNMDVTVAWPKELSLAILKCLRATQWD